MASFLGNWTAKFGFWVKILPPESILAKFFGYFFTKSSDCPVPLNCEDTFYLR